MQVSEPVDCDASNPRVHACDQEIETNEECHFHKGIHSEDCEVWLRLCIIDNVEMKKLVYLYIIGLRGD